MKPYACNNAPRPADGARYVAQAGWSVPVDGVRYPIFIMIVSPFDARECRYDLATGDAQCAGCRHARLREQAGASASV